MSRAAASSALPIPQHDNTPFYRGPPPFDISTTPPDDDSPLRDDNNDDDDTQQDDGYDDDDDLSANFKYDDFHHAAYMYSFVWTLLTQLLVTHTHISFNYDCCVLPIILS